MASGKMNVVASRTLLPALTATMSPTTAFGSPRRKTVLVTGTNGFLGHAVAKAFVAASCSNYGLLRKQDEVDCLHAHEIMSILGAPADLSLLPTL